MPPSVSMRFLTKVMIRKDINISIAAIDERLETGIIIGIEGGATSEAGVVPTLKISTLAVDITDLTQAPLVYKHQRSLPTPPD